MKIRSLCAVSAVVVMTLSAAWCGAQQAEETARKITDSGKDAVVTVQLVIETTSSYEGESEKRESKISATATVIDPSGLAVAALALVDPADSYRQFMPSDSGFQMSSRAVDVRMRTSDGTEIPADLVLKDRDLGIAFIRPKSVPAQPMTFVDLTQGSNPQAFDEVVVLSRLGQVASRSIAGCFDRVRTVVNKPRTFYVLNPYMHSSPGGPVYTLDGKPVGILLLRMSASKEREGGMGSGIDDYVTTVVLPCSTIANLVPQAKSAEPEKEPIPAPATKKPAAEKKPTAKPAKPTKPAAK